MKSCKILSMAAVLAMMALSASSAKADTIAFNDSGSFSANGGTGLVGFEFTVNHNINVTQLGFFASELGGGDTPHVALINVTGGQNNPPTVIYDTGALAPGSMTNDTWNYVSVGTPILLTVGNTYEVSAPLYWTYQYTSSGSFTYGGAIASETFLKDGGWNGWDNTNGGVAYDYTTQTSQSSPFISANFQYTLAANTPEPTSLSLLAVGSLALLRRRRKSNLHLSN